MYDVTPQNEQQADILKTFKDSDDFDFWSELRKPGYATTIMISPEAQDRFIATLEANQLQYENVIEDVEK